MDAQLKAKWVEALRSGEFTQEQNYIGNPKKKCLCCLGVGAIVANPTADLGSTGEAIQIIFGDEGFVDGDFAPHVMRLINMNDLEDKSFAEIARSEEHT